MTYRIIWRKKKYYDNPYVITEFSLEEMMPQVDTIYEYWFTTRALVPHDYTYHHFILRPKDGIKTLDALSAPAQQELMQIMQQRYDKNFTIYRNCPDDVTIPHKLHFHLAQFQNVIDIVATPENKSDIQTSTV